MSLIELLLVMDIIGIISTLPNRINYKYTVLKFVQVNYDLKGCLLGILPK